MTLQWIDIQPLSFNTLLLLEREQLSWFPGWLNEGELGLALLANPVVAWYLRHKCPEIEKWLEGVMKQARNQTPVSAERARQAELHVLGQINDLLVYAVDPSIYDAQPFLAWDSQELRSLADWQEKLVVDIGSGTGRLAFVAAEAGARAVFAVEPVANLRSYIRQKAADQGLTNVFPVDGLITRLPFPDDFIDITMGGHVFGGTPQAEYDEMMRITKPGGQVILCPGTSKTEGPAHDFLMAQGFEWAWFEEPGDGQKRKYWKIKK
jgi:SAM-dependent methyltransferase